MSKKPQYDPEEIRFPDQVIVTSPLVPEMEQSYICLLYTSHALLRCNP